MVSGRSGRLYQQSKMLALAGGGCQWGCPGYSCPTRRNAKVVQRFLKRLIAQFGDPCIVITDKLRSYCKTICDLVPGANHRAHKWLNNRIEGSHKPTRKSKKVMGRFKSSGRRNGSLTITIRSTLFFRPAVINSLPLIQSRQPIFNILQKRSFKNKYLENCMALQTSNLSLYFNKLTES